jgi:hypothetical protein
MNYPLIIGFVRHGLTTLFTALAGRGFVEGNQVEAIVGAILLLGNVTWFAVDKIRNKKA